MLDYDLAELYEVPTKVLNQAVKRNADRFPEDFMFRLTEQEWVQMRSQIVTTSAQQDDTHIQVIDRQLNADSPNWSQNVTSSQESSRRSQFVTASEGTSKRFRNKTLLPYAFTEHGVTMLASVLKSPKAVKMSIEVVRAFIALKQSAIEQNSIAIQFQEIRDRLGEHDVQLNAIGLRLRA